jgi:hypothetical protein
MTLFNILYTNNNVNNKIKTKVNNAILKWENVLNNKLPDGVSEITINLNFIDDGNNGTLGWAIIDEFQYKNNIDSFDNIFPLEGTFYINLYYSVSEKTILHEIGHILGIGLFWIWFDSPIDKSNRNDRYYIGTNAVREYKKYCQYVGIDPDTIYGIPVEDDGHDGTNNLHPEEGHETHISSTNNRKKNGIFHPALNDELMTGISDGTNALSRITIGFLEDIGYNVDYSQADIYSLTLPPEYNPVIILLGNPNEIIEVKTTYIDAGATAFDTLYGDLTSSIIIVNTVNIDIVGNYTITYNVSNKNGNTADTIIRNVSVVDTTKPVITLLGNINETIEVKSTYIDVGATALDNLDGDLTNTITIINTVNTDAIGDYTITYNVTDTNGNMSEPVIRNVSVVDTTKPVITLLGNINEIIEVKSTYIDLGATALDNFDEDLTNSITTINTVNTDVIGDYTVTYNVTDANGNISDPVIRNVSIVDTTKPVITLLGNINETIEVKSDYIDFGATALDNLDGDLTNSITIINTVNTDVIGDYTITYNVTDANGNMSEPVIRNVSVIDRTKPVITLLGNINETIKIKTTYIDLGATALDNLDGNLTNSITIINTVNTDVIGDYTITYNVTDANGNMSEPVIRNVSIVDTTKPVITLLGNINETIEVKSDYIDDGATALDNLDGDLTNSITIINTVNTDIIGDYTITYNVTDANGNKAEPIVRNVSIIDIENNDFIQLKKGWNMIVQSTYVYIECSINNVISPFYVYDKSYIRLEENNGFVKLNKNQCAWVKVANDISILYKYNQSNLTKPVSENKVFIQLKKGWNMIGQSNYEQALFSTDNTQSDFYIFDKSYIKLEENNGFVKLNKYQAAWIKVTDDITIFYMKLES